MMIQMGGKRVQCRGMTIKSGNSFGRSMYLTKSKFLVGGKVNLVRRQVLQEDKCEFCQRCSETIIHALWDCGATQDVWAGSVARIQKSGGKFDDFMQLFQVMMAKLSMEELETFLVQSWLIWHRRNMVLFGSKMQHPGQLNQRVTDLLREYREAQSSLAIPLVRPSSLQNWKPPAGQLFKLNFDAAIFKNGSGVGAVIRNATGEVMVALSARGEAVADSEEAKVRAYRKALEFAIDVGFSELMVEGDNSVVMSTISSNKPNWSRLGVIYDDIGYLAANLSYVSFSCIRRNANSVAHSLARYANELVKEVVWLEDSPPPAHEPLYLDLSFLNE